MPSRCWRRIMAILLRLLRDVFWCRYMSRFIFTFSLITHNHPARDAYWDYFCWCLTFVPEQLIVNHTFIIIIIFRLFYVIAAYFHHSRLSHYCLYAAMLLRHCVMFILRPHTIYFIIHRLFLIFFFFFIYYMPSTLLTHHAHTLIIIVVCRAHYAFRYFTRYSVYMRAIHVNVPLRYYFFCHFRYFSLTFITSSSIFERSLFSMMRCRVYVIWCRDHSVTNVISCFFRWFCLLLINVTHHHTRDYAI